MRTQLLVTICFLVLAAVPTTASATQVVADNVLPEPCFCSASIGDACFPCVNIQMSQSFIPTATGQFETLEVALNVFGSADLTVDVYTGNAELPDQLLGSVTAPASIALSGSGSQAPGRPMSVIDMRSAEIQLNQGVEYVFVLTSTGGPWEATFSQNNSYLWGRAYNNVDNAGWNGLFVGDSDISFRASVDETIPVRTTSWGGVKALF